MLNLSCHAPAPPPCSLSINSSRLGKRKMNIFSVMWVYDLALQPVTDGARFLQEEFDLEMPGTDLSVVTYCFLAS